LFKIVSVVFDGGEKLWLSLSINHPEKTEVGGLASGGQWKVARRYTFKPVQLDLGIRFFQIRDLPASGVWPP